MIVSKNIIYVIQFVESKSCYYVSAIKSNTVVSSYTAALKFSSKREAEDYMYKHGLINGYEIKEVTTTVEIN